MVYTVILENDPEAGTVGASSADIPDVMAVGNDEADAVARFRNALEGHFAYLREENLPIPSGRHKVVQISV
jgi:predicted RNase H-like HicB family nuclease